uniref:Uncharacterized protein n=1 Tax=Arundo donax TaxID=35708 RepID=A0A0A9ENG8_ARUDO
MVSTVTDKSSWTDFSDQIGKVNPA